MTPLCLIAAALSAGLGLFIFLRPAYAIEVQRRFYESINWRIEPVSMPKELRNTRIMGLFLIFLSLAAAAYLLLKKGTF